jgi:CheY-like chemotaxis protein
MAALQSKDGAIRGEAAVACARMAAAGKGKCAPEVITTLGDIAGREVVRIAMVIDGDAMRANTLANSLQGAGIMPTVSNSGALGLSMLRRMPGVDAIVIADQLPDLTTAQVIDDIRADSAYAKTPLMLLSSAENAGEPYGDRIQGVLAQPGDVTALTGALDANVGSDRARADALAVQAADALASLAGVQDIRSAVPGLTRTLAARSDAVVVPAARALGIAGGAEQVAPLAAVVADGNRSEGARTASAYAIASIVGRGNAVSGEVVKSLDDVAHSDAPLGVRQAAAAALGNMNMSHSDRAQHLMPHGATTQG